MNADTQMVDLDIHKAVSKYIFYDRYSAIKSHNQRRCDVPGRGLPGPMTQLGPLRGPGLSVGGGSEGSYGLPA